MAAKHQRITELYRRTGVTTAKRPQAWQCFLAAAFIKVPARANYPDWNEMNFCTDCASLSHMSVTG